MLYKFKSAVTGDLIMLGPQGDHMLHLIGHAPAAKGIIEAAAMPAAIAALQAAIDADSQPRPDADGSAPPPVGLRQRLWPVIEMLRRCHAANEPVVWGV